MPRTHSRESESGKEPPAILSQEAPRGSSNMSETPPKLVMVVRNPVTVPSRDLYPDCSPRSRTSLRSRASRSITIHVAGPEWAGVLERHPRIGMYALHLESWLRYFPLAQIHRQRVSGSSPRPPARRMVIQDFLGSEAHHGQLLLQQDRDSLGKQNRASCLDAWANQRQNSCTDRP